jgi:ribosome-associated toxin RatA of RatAB toxin-antitoxin module
VKAGPKVYLSQDQYAQFLAPCYKEFGFQLTDEEKSDWEAKSKVSEFQLKLSYVTMIITKNFANKILQHLEKIHPFWDLAEDWLQDFQHKYLTRYNEG